MARVMKLEVYVVDYSSEYENAEHFVGEFKDLVGSEMWVEVQIGNVKESAEFEWEDDLKINESDSTIEDLEDYLQQ